VKRYSAQPYPFYISAQFYKPSFGLVSRKLGLQIRAQASGHLFKDDLNGFFSTSDFFFMVPAAYARQTGERFLEAARHEL
jgi:hypothetical protein